MKPCLIVGLGNPGLKYRKTRHNMGFMVIDYLSQKLGVKVKKSSCRSLTGEASYNGRRVILAKPQTYMNNSGQAVRELMEYNNLELSDLIVVYDDMDVDISKIRIRKKGGSGTHNGMKSILYHVQEENFIRIRVGISPGEDRDTIRYVLGKFRKAEQQSAFEGIEKAAESILETIDRGIDSAMNKFNG